MLLPLSVYYFKSKLGAYYYPSYYYYLPPISLCKQRINVASIFKGAFTSLFILVWEGLKPMTNKLSTLLSLSKNILDKAIKLIILNNLRRYFSVIPSKQALL